MVTISKNKLHALVTDSWMNRTIIAPFIGIQQFLIVLGGAECLIGFLWLLARLTIMAFWVMLAHLFTTFLPVLFLPNETW